MEYLKEFDDKLKKRYYQERTRIGKELAKKGIFVSEFTLDDYAMLAILTQEGVFDNQFPTVN